MTSDSGFDPNRGGPEAVTGGEQAMGDKGAETADAEATERAVQPSEAVEHPAKVMRIGSMIKHLLEEVRQAPLDEASRVRLRDIYDTSVKELSQGLSGDLRAELDRLTLPLEGPTPSDAQLRIAQAQLVGWLEGLFHGIQATLFAQQMAARAQLEEMMQQRGLPAPSGPASHDGPGGAYL